MLTIVSESSDQQELEQLDHETCKTSKEAPNERGLILTHQPCLNKRLSVSNLVLVSLVTTNLTVTSHALNFYWL